MLQPFQRSKARTFTSPVPFPVTIVNNSASLKDVFIIIKGIDASIPNNKKQQFYDLANKKWGNSAVAVKLSSLPSSTSPKGNIINMPHINSGIVYLSFGKAITFSGLVPPDFANPSNPNFNITYDKFEISFLPTDGFPYIDITNVDFFCVPLQLEETLSNGTKNGPKGFSVDQATVFTSFSSNLKANNWSAIIQEIKNTTTQKFEVLRVIAPNKALVEQPPVSHKFDASLFQHYVDHVWDYYKSGSGKSIKVDMSEISKANPKYKNVVFEGVVSNGKFVFSGKDAQGNPLPAISFVKPVGSDLIKDSIFGCANLFAAPNNTPTSVPAKNLGAAFNVGILAHKSIPDAVLSLMPPTSTLSPNGKNWTSYKSNFYNNTIQIPDPANPAKKIDIECYNVYAGVIHANAIHRDDYAFAFDDVTQSDSTLANKNATGAIVTIQKLA
ncbi:glucan endo-1,3-beta-glucosidase [Kordia sp. SMS9]|uniref:beta-1,3-glucanase family protein n=1 Tax=Kordia sp. SMS9 TaxID=2282170 RepID=UPI000E0DFD5F|nr:beta-1,3-glucanase family protein [Kordia sp. SMS9]AXG71750.1 glucan endo-1,3-beta-glucosidase [Kordia sp. SMS9]